MFELDNKSRLPIYEQIVNEMQAQVVKGILEPGDRVPSIRELAALLGINPNTVSKAYQELERLEILSTVKGRGTFITEQTGKMLSEKTLLDAKKRLKEAVIHLKALGISEAEINNWVKEAEEE
ncbi:GntR family transcriptional regulator [Listeria grayi]|uniref:GntR family transcriptional regulator n=1 Tax=Listeria grayi TaxID=1641 RepID=UPI00162A19E2|nr:GntR family transcriptional regulator [Listeria grayi]MBC1921687.1 GntR family transcriptional regulator [Listeria grayi]